MRAILAVLAVTATLLFEAAMLGVFFYLACLPRIDLLAKLGLGVFAILSGLMLASAIHVSLKASGGKPVFSVLVIAIVLALATVPLAAAFGVYLSRPYLTPTFGRLAFGLWTVVGVIFMVIGLWGSRRQLLSLYAVGGEKK